LIPVDVAEIGIRIGHWAVKFLTKYPSVKRYICVDPWTIYPDKTEKENALIFGKNWNTQEKQDYAYDKFCKAIAPFRDKIVELHTFSHEAAPLVEDNSLDIVYIDADHTEEAVAEDIKLWYPKLRLHGLMAGDDYREPGNRDEWGVRQAVDRVFGNLIEQAKCQWWIWKEEVEGNG